MTSEYRKKYNKNREIKGLCLKCNNPRVPEKTLCEECLVKNRLRAKNYRQKRRNQGVCINCGVNKVSKGCCGPCKDKLKSYTEKDKLKVFKHYGMKCNCCGTEGLVFLTIDHIEGGGRQHRASFKGTLYRWLINNSFPEGFQTLCWNCNSAKHMLGQCPHKKEGNV